MTFLQGGPKFEVTPLLSMLCLCIFRVYFRLYWAHNYAYYYNNRSSGYSSNNNIDDQLFRDQFHNDNICTV